VHVIITWAPLAKCFWLASVHSDNHALCGKVKIRRFVSQKTFPLLGSTAKSIITRIEGGGTVRACVLDLVFRQDEEPASRSAGARLI